MLLHGPILGAASYVPYLGTMIVGFVVGTIGHIVRSTPIILMGIVIIGGTSVAIMVGVSTS